MGAIVPLGRIGIKVLDEVERGVRATRAAAPDGAPLVELTAAEAAIPFATADGSAAPAAVFPADGGAARPDEARAFLAKLSVPAFSAIADVAAAPQEARGVLVLRVSLK